MTFVLVITYNIYDGYMDFTGYRQRNSNNSDH